MIFEALSFDVTFFSKILEFLQLFKQKKSTLCLAQLIIQNINSMIVESLNFFVDV